MRRVRAFIERHHTFARLVVLGHEDQRAHGVTEGVRAAHLVGGVAAALVEVQYADDGDTEFLGGCGQRVEAAAHVVALVGVAVDARGDRVDDQELHVVFAECVTQGGGVVGQLQAGAYRVAVPCVVHGEEQDAVHVGACGL